MKSKPTSPPRSDHAFATLRSRILDGDLAPGELVAESAAARELGVSRVPIREALFTLEREGLVEFSDTGRAYVKELSPHDFEELFVLRLVLEPVAARLVRGAREMERGNYEHPLDVRSNDELGYLANRFADMRRHERAYLGGLEQAARLKSRFLTVAAHELRTPDRKSTRLNSSHRT